MSTIPKPTYEYIGRAPCGCVTTIIADIPGLEKETGRDVGEAIARGLTVNRIPRNSDEFQSIMSRGIGHTCKELPLFSFALEESMPKHQQRPIYADVTTIESQYRQEIVAMIDEI